MNCLKLKFLGTHSFEVYKEEPLVNAHNNQIGFVIISRCKNCGKIHKDTVFTNNSYR